MNDSEAADAHAARARRVRRAAVARRVLDASPQAAAALSWDDLDRAPAWLALPEAALARFARQVGAVSCAPAVRMWIDGRRLAAARAALGEAFLQALLAAGDAPDPGLAAAGPPMEAPGQVDAWLHATGAGVLCASLPPGALQRAARDLLGLPVEMAVAPALAAAVVARAHDLAARCAGSSAVGGTSA